MEHMGYIYVLHFEILAAVFHNPRQSITVEKSDLLAAHVSTLSQHFMAGHTSGIGINPNKGLYINMWPRKDCLQSGRNILRQNKASETRTGSRGKFAQHKASRSRAQGHYLYLFGNIKGNISSMKTHPTHSLLFLRSSPVPDCPYHCPGMVLVRLLADAEDTTKGGTLHKKLQQAIEDQGWNPGSKQKVEKKLIPHIQSISIGIEYGMFFSNLNIAYGMFFRFSNSEIMGRLQTSIME
jgi:hypothetical protein